MFALKSGQSDINDLNQSYDKRVLDDYENPIDFNTVLFNIATIMTRKRSSSEFNTDSTKEDISFVLKDNIKWNTITAIIPVVKQKSMLNNEISKNAELNSSIKAFKSSFEVLKTQNDENEQEIQEESSKQKQQKEVAYLRPIHAEHNIQMSSEEKKKGYSKLSCCLT